MPPSTRYVLEELSPGNVLLWRFVAGGLVVVALVVLFRPRMPDRAHLPQAIGLGLFGVLGFNVPVAFGINMIQGGIAAMLLGTQPAFIAMLAALLLRESISPRMIAGLFVAMAGCGVIAFAPSGGEALSGRYLLGCSLVLLGSFLYSLYSVVAKPFLGERIPAASVAMLGTFFASPFVIPFGSEGFLDGLGRLDVAGWLAALLLAAGASVFAPVLFNVGLSLGYASRAGMYLYLVPLAGLIASALLLDERFTVASLLGGVLIILGVLLATLDPGMLRGVGRARRVAG